MKYTLEHQKLMLWVPAPVVLCLLLVFHGLGGGTGSAANPGVTMNQGINKNLPSAKADTGSKAPDKIQLYAAAAADSVKFREQQKADPSISGRLFIPDSVRGNVQSRSRVDSGSSFVNAAIDQRRLNADATADKLLARVEQLGRQLNQSGRVGGEMAASRNFVPDRAAVTGRDLSAERLSALSQQLPDNPKTARDPEMERIDAMLDKLIRIQHPGLVVDDAPLGAAARTFVLERPAQAAPVANLRLEEPNADAPSGFIEIGEDDKPDTARYSHERALRAVVDGDQTVTGGSTVALRLVDAGVINGLEVPSGQLLYGEVSIANERMMMHISSLRIGDEVLPVSIQVYDLDGLAGIRVPGAVTREVSKESASEAISSLGLASMDPSLTGQAANAGLQLAKSLSSRKIRAIRVQLPAGYQVLLMNTKTR